MTSNLWYNSSNNQTKGLYIMKGSIRFFAGFFIVFGAVGALDADPTASLPTMITIAACGLILSYTGVRAMKKV